MVGQFTDIYLLEGRVMWSAYFYEDSELGDHCTWS